MKNIIRERLPKNLIWLEILVGLGIAVGLVVYFSATNYIPSGADTYGHLFKPQILGESIKRGNLYPLFAKEWYNGIQIFRYWPIFSYYVMSIGYIITGDILMTFYIYIAEVFLISYIGWVLIANRERKPIFILLGVCYFFLPDNIRLMFSEGNMLRVFVLGLVPLFFYFFTNLIQYKKSFVGVVVMATVITMSHFMVAAMCAVIFTIYGFFAGLKNKTWYYGPLAYICGLCTAGILLVPGLIGGLVADTSTAADNSMKRWSQSLLLSFSLSERDTACTIGISVLIIMALVIIFGKKKCGTIIAAVFMIMTSEIFCDFLIQLPINQLWWMARYMQMCYVLVLYEFGMLEFKKQWRQYLVCLLVVADFIPSAYMLTNYRNPIDKNALLQEGIDATDNRLGVIDESGFGPYMTYETMNQGIDYSQGWAIQGASTEDNVIEYTEALEYGYFDYAFKSMLELGCDSVIVKKGILPKKYKEKDLLASADRYGFKLIKQSTSSYLFDSTLVSGQYGLDINYDNLAIGSSALYISYMYPSFKPGESETIDDYSFDELKAYKKIYLSGFEYSSNKKLEELVTKLSDSGVEVYIDASSLDLGNYNVASFLGVQGTMLKMNDINYLHFDGKNYSIDLPYAWNTMTLSLQESDIAIETFSVKETNRGYYAKRDNIHILGLNLPYLQLEKKQKNITKVLDAIFGMDEKNSNPTYEIVPIQVEYSDKGIEINSPKRVLTNIAYQDNYRSDRELLQENNLLVVDEGKTSIKFVYSMLLPGLLLSMLGIALTIFFNWLIFKKDIDPLERIWKYLINAN